MRTRPEHGRALLHADTVALRDCADRIDALTGGALPAQCGPDWTRVLTGLAERCRVAAAELERAQTMFFTESDGSAEADEPAAPAASAAQARAATAAAAAATAAAGRLLAVPRAAADPLLKPVLRRLSEH